MEQKEGALSPIKIFKIRFPHLFIGIVSFVVSLLIALFIYTNTSPIYADYISSSATSDSLFITYCGRMLLEGKTPYVDFYDHKGLYLWWVSALGQWIGGRVGFWILEFLFTYLTSFILLETVYIKRKDSIFSLLMAGAIHSTVAFLDFGGGSEGEFILPFIALSLYFYVKGFKDNSLRWLYIASLIAGVEMGISLNSRPLDGIFGGALCVGYFALFLKNDRKPMHLIHNIIASLIGLIASILPFFIVSMVGGYFPLMMKSIYLDSGSYILAKAQLLDRIVGYIFLAASLAIAITLYIFSRKKDSPLPLFLFISYSVIFIAMAFLMRYSHYLIGLLPMLSITLILFFFKEEDGKAIRITSYVLSFLLSVAALVMTMGYYANFLPIWDYSYSYTERFKKDLSYIPEECSDSILAINVSPAAYALLNASSPSPYFVNQDSWSTFNTDIIPSIKDTLDLSLTDIKHPETVLLNPESEKYDTYLTMLDTYYEKFLYPDASYSHCFEIYLRK